MGRAKGHLRLVDPLPPEDPDLAHEREEFYRPAELPSAWHWPPPPVDTGGVVRFVCPHCGKTQVTDRPVLQRWCTGNNPATGTRTHAPVEMVRNELRD
jgi:hypothetical protein